MELYKLVCISPTQKSSVFGCYLWEIGIDTFLGYRYLISKRLIVENFVGKIVWSTHDKLTGMVEKIGLTAIHFYWAWFILILTDHIPWFIGDYKCRFTTMFGDFSQYGHLELILSRVWLIRCENCFLMFSWLNPLDWDDLRTESTWFCRNA